MARRRRLSAKRVTSQAFQSGYGPLTELGHPLHAGPAPISAGKEGHVMRRSLMVAIIGATVLGVVAPPALAAPKAPPSLPPTPPVSSTTALWQMNEPFGATVMYDSGPNHLNGVIDPSGVTSGFTYGGATGYDWIRRPPTTPPASPERVIQVPDNPLLDAGTGTFTLEIRYRTKEKFGNIIQKGQAHSYGGQWKIQNPKGIPSCLFSGSLGQVATGAKTPLNDNQWHVLTCVKTPTGVTMYVDGVYRNKKNGTTGTIDNKKAVTIGGKLECDQVTVTCDYFSGDIDYVRIDHT